MKFLKSCVAVVLLGISAPAVAWELADVAVLVPLASTFDQINLGLKYSAQGKQGELLPLHLSENLLDMVPEAPNAQVWPHLTVLGIRIDPCFVEGAGPFKCQAQIRLVWQPVIKRGVRIVEARDSAVHSFYNLTDLQFEAFLRDWQTVAVAKGDVTWGIHPTLRAEGLGGETWARMKEILLNHAGEKRLVRVTQMNVLAGEQIWTFAGFDYSAGAVRDINIPVVDQRTQGVVQGASMNQVFSGRLIPPMETPLGRFIENSRALERYSEEEIRSLVQEVADLENPLTHNSGTVDCASCHMAHSVHQWISINVDIGKYNINWGNVPLSVEGPVRPNQLRAMGYFSRWPVMSSRTLTESQESLGHLNQVSF